MRIRLKNITYHDYLYNITEQEREKYDFAAKFGDIIKGNDVFSIGKFEDRPFGFVKDFQNLYGNLDIEPEAFFFEYFRIFKEWLQIEKETILQTPIFDYYNNLTYCAAEIRKINRIEETLVSTIGDQTNDTEANFGKFGVLPQFLELAGNDLTKIDQIGRLQYSLCFSVLLYRKELYESQYRAHKNRKK